MSPLGIASTLFSLFSTEKSNSSSQTSTQNSDFSATSGNDFSSSLAVRMASMQAQSVNSLIGSVFGDSKVSASANLFGATSSSTTDPFSLPGLSTSAQGLSASGRNISLFDPESAYTMMSLINSQDAKHKAQFSELSAMKSAVSEMQQAGQKLSGTEASMSNEDITTRLQAFVDKYNAWSQRFEGTVQRDGVLKGTQAAEISLNELEQSVGNIFNGAKYGIHGLEDLGVTIDHSTNTAAFNAQTLNAILATNKEGAVSTINQFSANFTQAAELLGSDNNFIPNRLANLDRVIDYVDSHKSSLQSEFGRGDPAKVSPQVAKALAAYNQNFAV